MTFENKTYNELIRLEKKLTEEYNNIQAQSLKDGLSYEEFCEKAHDTKQNLFFLDKYKRKEQTPELVFDKEWQGVQIPFEEFVTKSLSEQLTDDDGYGYYATINGKSDIRIKPSDVTEGIYRDDFPYIIWFTYEV